MKYRIMEDPDSLVTVAPPLCCDSDSSGHQRRPGPVFDSREGVFQMPITGKYRPASFDEFSPDPDTHLTSSNYWARPAFNDYLPSCSYRYQAINTECKVS